MRLHRSALASAIALTVVGTPCAAQRAAAEVPYAPTPAAVVRAMLEAADVGPDDVVYDLGSGDGRIPIAAAADFGARGVGVEIEGDLVRLARENARAAGVADRVSFIEHDLFLLDLHEATVVTLYLLPMINYRLQPKLLAELAPGTRVVSHAFDMADWNPDREFEVDGRWVFYWVVPAPVAGVWQWSIDDSSVPTHYLTLDQRFQEIDGSVRGATGDVDILDATLTGTRLSFITETTERGETIRTRYTARVGDGTLEGTLEVEGGTATGPRPWRATLRSP